jgi:hypothetical protein
MATSTSYNAAYVGFVSGVHAGRVAVDTTTLAANANTAALAIQTALSSPVLSAAKSSLLTHIIRCYVEGRNVLSLSTASIVSLCAEYTALTANIVD